MTNDTPPVGKADSPLPEGAKMRTFASAIKKQRTKIGTLLFFG